MSTSQIEPLLDEEVSLGSILCGERMTLGKSLSEASSQLRIKESYIAAIEANSYHDIDRKDMIVGYLGSYARYLNLDSKEVVSIYRDTYGAEIETTVKKQNDKNAKISATSDKNSRFKEGFGGYGAKHKTPPSLLSRSFQSVSLAFPLVLALGVFVGVATFGMSVLNSVQVLQVSASESLPRLDSEFEIATEGQVNESLQVVTAPLINYEEIYEAQQLTVPIVEPRAGPISQIAVNVSEENPNQVEVVLPNSEISELEEPLVAVGPIAPTLELVPFQEAWVQITTETGDRLFESLLKPGESAEVPLEGEIKFLKAGNATQLFIRVNGQIYGPVGQDGASVVRGVPMLPTEVEASMTAVSEEQLQELQEVESAFLAQLDQ